MIYIKVIYVNLRYYELDEDDIFLDNCCEDIVDCFKRVEINTLEGIKRLRKRNNLYTVHMLAYNAQSEYVKFSDEISNLMYDLFNECQKYINQNNYENQLINKNETLLKFLKQLEKPCQKSFFENQVSLSIYVLCKEKVPNYFKKQCRMKHKDSTQNYVNEKKYKENMKDVGSDEKTEEVEIGNRDDAKNIDNEKDEEKLSCIEDKKKLGYGEIENDEINHNADDKGEAEKCNECEHKDGNWKNSDEDKNGEIVDKNELGEIVGKDQLGEIVGKDQLGEIVGKDENREIAGDWNECEHKDENGKKLDEDENGEIIDKNEMGEIVGKDENEEIVDKIEIEIVGDDDNGEIVGHEENGKIVVKDENGDIVGRDENGTILSKDAIGEIVGKYENGETVDKDEIGQFMGTNENGEIVGKNEIEVVGKVENGKIVDQQGSEIVGKDENGEIVNKDTNGENACKYKMIEVKYTKGFAEFKKPMIEEEERFVKRQRQKRVEANEEICATQNSRCARSLTNQSRKDQFHPLAKSQDSDATDTSMINRDNLEYQDIRHSEDDQQILKFPLVNLNKNRKKYPQLEMETQCRTRDKRALKRKELGNAERTSSSKKLVYIPSNQQTIEYNDFSSVNFNNFQFQSQSETISKEKDLKIVQQVVENLDEKKKLPIPGPEVFDNFLLELVQLFIEYCDYLDLPLLLDAVFSIE